MLLDDRLATVLASPLSGEAAARTQYRQLVDLLGSADCQAAGELGAQAILRLSANADALTPEERARQIEQPALATRNHAALTFLAWRRIEQLSSVISAEERSRILRDPGLRIRSPRLVELLAQGDAKPAASALATARLGEQQWLDLIPRLPVMARGFLRHRRDLPASVRDLLRQMGVEDLVLPRPEGEVPVRPAAPSTPPPVPGERPLQPAEGEDRDGIRALLRRIEAFREGRKGAATAPGHPRLPLGDAAEEEIHALPSQVAFTADQQGRIDWVEGPLAPLLSGMRLGPAAPGAVAVLEDRAARALDRLQPLRAAALTIDAAPAVSGDWRLDAEPVFAAAGGHFTGYRGRLRRPLPATVAPPTLDSSQDRMRQVLHELRTPVNAIQGFAEIIQQQLFGPAPNEYRALAAGVAVDAAKLLAAFDEIDRLARLESGALTLSEGEADLAEAVSGTIQRLDGVLRPRSAGFDLAVSEASFATRLARDELLLLAWRLLASLAGATGPGERLAAQLSADGSLARLDVALPASLAAVEDPFALGRSEQRPAVSAGMFGPGFSFRLARAEARAAGGGLDFSEQKLRLSLPLLTGC